VQRKQNPEREDAVPASVVRKMLERWEVPDATEAHAVVWAWS
jgi:tRNA uridine 5-carbamoylmethylation protein Kti12